ncbi:MAG: hypothetical protein A2452_08505 [Candidatus Firestonebacteria bacterium RIFOXYC2_FULL_39_67]|nr:MAG: hypothetical protein A2536_05490 [Candidatus Firestonebacteria bacterium RIFOXYD2_FULL_39_29]OGF56954.1 MAG: hypothetical protein A2452_08505 [Candidatus Firestonebacteria bacterium RIFOXYC2_FULL_39_67]
MKLSGPKIPGVWIYLFLVVFFINTAYCDTYFLKDGSRVVGTLVKENGSTSTVKTDQFGELTLQKENIVSVLKDDEGKEDTPKAVITGIKKQIINLVENLIKSYKTAQENTRKNIKIVVIPFQTEDSRLAKQQVGFGIAELMTDYIVEYEKDSIETASRSDLKQILEEQKLSLSGLISEASAIKTGKILNTEAIIIGSISVVGDFYLVSARVVDTVTAKVLSTESVKLPLKELRKEADEYLIAPEDWCFYISWNYGRVTQTAGAASNGTLTYSNISTFSDVVKVGFGIKRIFFEHILFDFGTQFTNLTSISVKYDIIDSSGSPKLEGVEELWFHVPVCASLSWLEELGPGKISAGFGVHYFQKTSPGGTFVPTAILGYELRLKKRVGLGIYANYFLSGTDISITVPNDNMVINKVSMPVGTFSPLFLQMKLGFYF